MSVPVDIAELVEKSEEFGPVAFLVTVGDSGAPHVVSVPLTWDGDDLMAAAGSRTSGNVEARPSVTVLWPAKDGGDYCLIVDGAARVVADPAGVAVTPVRAVLHRLATADAALPSCVTLLDKR